MKALNRRKFLLQTGLGVAGTALGARAGSSSPDTTGYAGTASSDPGVTAEVFAEKAVRLLPLEKRFAHHRVIADTSVFQPERDPQGKPGADEFSLAEGHWVIRFSEEEPLIQTAAEDLKLFLEQSMQVVVRLEKQENGKPGKGKGEYEIRIGTTATHPAYKKTLTAPKGYALGKVKEGILVCGADAAGVLQGVFNLEARMKLRQGPYLPRNLKLLRNSIYERRMVVSGLGWMDWPDNQLSHVARNGFDGIFASIYANPNGDRTTAENSTDFYARLLHKIRKQDPEVVKDLIRRAARYGIKVYVPIIYQYTGTAESEEGLRTLVRKILGEFPEIGGYVLLTEGFWYKKWGGLHGADEAHVQDWARNWSKAIEVVSRECHRVNPETHVLAWEYNIDFRPQNTALKRFFIKQLPDDAIPMLTWENGKGFELDGMQGYLRDYSLSQVGPAEVTQAQLEEAAGRKMRAFSKVDTCTSWQFGTIPYLPFPGQWRKRYDALEKYGIRGTLESWSSGFTPNFVAELRYWTCWDNSLPFQDLLGAMADRLFGAAQRERVLEAWTYFDEAIRMVPDTGPNMGTNNAIGNPLFFQEPPVRTATFHHSWINHNQWMGYLGGELNPYWPFTVSRMVFYPDFSNKVNRAEQYARGATGIVAPAGTRLLPVFLKYLGNAADRMEQGLQLYRAAALACPEWKRQRAVKEVVVAEHLHRMMQSNIAVLTFESLRFQWANGTEKAQRTALLDQMENLVREEIDRTRLSLLATERDSRLGFQFEQDYVYTPYSLSEKLKLLEETLSVQLPEARKG